MIKRLCLNMMLVGLCVMSCGEAQSKENTMHIGPSSLIHPGSKGFPSDIADALTQAWNKRSKTYEPRTMHKNKDGTPLFINRLFLEASPYLIQHAHNPVNWFPWGEEAFALAKKLNRPILLSVGYSTCHWCHVMEEESFEDLAVAKYLNENYIAIKVDREERPDVDGIYMSAVQLMVGRGGWPMTVWLMPDQTPFYGGTYFPREQFLAVLNKLSQVYKEQPSEVVDAAQELVGQMRQQLSGLSENATSTSHKSAITQAIRIYMHRFDTINGGMKGSPKFPSSLPVSLLFRLDKTPGVGQLSKMAFTTLNHMASGGIYDHVGGGFHRYSTDAAWLVPHFEKMLYDNALLITAYLDGYVLSKYDQYSRVVRETIQWVSREMTSPEGMFYSATDADSLSDHGKREEGIFFTWTPAEIDALFSKKIATWLKQYYHVTDQGNFEGRTIFNTDANNNDDVDFEMLAEAKETLYKTRQLRPPPIRDDKVLVAWNGLMISALARAAFVLNEPHYATMAEKAAEGILKHLYINGRLYRSFSGNKARHNAYLDDYAFMIEGFLTLHQATNNLKWITHAIEFDRVIEKHYADKKNGGFFMTSDDHESLLVREKPSYDGAIPSGNSVTAMNLLRLYELTTDNKYLERAEMLFSASSAMLKRNPTSVATMLAAIDFFTNNVKEIALITKGSKEDAKPFLDILRNQYVPNQVWVVAQEGDDIINATKTIPWLRAKKAYGGKTTAYVCSRHICQIPTSDLDKFTQQINSDVR